MEKQKTFRVIITKDPDDIGYVADIQSLKYCVSYADTIDEAIVNIKETLAGVIQVMQDEGIPIPDNSNQIELSETKKNPTRSNSWQSGHAERPVPVNT